MMADSEHFKNPNVYMVNSDQFHRISSVTPIHHPIINGSCALSDEKCAFNTITVTQNFYSSETDFTKLGRFQCAADHQSAKLKSRQALRIASGEKDASFHDYD